MSKIKVIVSLKFIVFLILSKTCYSQYPVFDEFDFQSGGYCLTGKVIGGDHNSFIDSLGDWYIDDVNSLLKIKDTWILKNEISNANCGGQYQLFLSLEGEILETYTIHLDCNQFSNAKKAYVFDSKFIKENTSSFNPSYSKHYSLDLIEARELLKASAKDSELTYLPKFDWERYEGSFMFTYHCTKNEDCTYGKNSISSKVESEIREKYPNDDFLFSEIGWDMASVTFNIVSDKSFDKSFNLYDREKFVWKPFKPSFDLYWKVYPNKKAFTDKDKQKVNVLNGELESLKIIEDKNISLYMKIAISCFVLIGLFLFFKSKKKT